MRYLLVGLMMSMLACGLAFAQDEAATEDEAAVDTKHEVTGIPLYQGPEYDSLDVTAQDIDNLPPEFHSFQHRPVDEVGYSPLTLEDFRFPVVKRTAKEFSFERLYYPDHAVQVWHSDCQNYTVTAFFFTRDMVRDHIQRLVDGYYICEPAVLQQVIDYYAEVTPQCGEAISWVWFAVDHKGHTMPDRMENRYFTRYLSNFKDKFYLEFGLPKVQDNADEELREFLYQYTKRADGVCGPEFKERSCVCDECAAEGEDCAKCTGCGDAPLAICSVDPANCKSCPTYDCTKCPEPCTKPGDEQLWCPEFTYRGFNYDINEHYLYYPRKVVIEDITYDPLAQAYRWKFAWRFNDCEVDFLRQLCTYSERADFALLISDPHWYARVQLDKTLSRDILAAMDPQTWGNVWPAGNVPFDMECCDCPLPYCDGNCEPMPAVGWDYAEPTAEVVPVMAPPPPPPAPAPAGDFNYFPPPAEEEDEVIEVPGKG